MGSPFKHLFSPFRIGSLALRNRIVSLPHGTSMMRDGAITEGQFAYYKARVDGGVGLIINGGISVHPTSSLRSRTQIEAFDERVLPDIKRRNAMIHAGGCGVIAQLLHLGREMIGGQTDLPRVAPSAVRSPRDPYPPHALDLKEIEEIVTSFAGSAHNLEQADFDGFEVHAAHGYLVAQFLSPLGNRRSDAYGGSLSNRMRFMREIIEGLRARCGADKPVGVRLSASEEVEGGLTLDDTLRIVETIGTWGTVDYLNITLGVRGRYVKDMSTKHAVAADAAAAIRRSTDMAVLVGQRVTTPELAEDLLERGAADLVGVNRALFSDPDWPAKAAAGATHAIRPCIACLQDCRNGPPALNCSVNPETGREGDPTVKLDARAPRARSVAVVGGGPAGLEAAVSLGMRGHRVSLFEADDRLGGQMRIAARGPWRAEQLGIIEFYEREANRLGVELNLGTRATADMLKRYDAIVVSTGARPLPAPAGALAATDLLSQDPPAPYGEGRALVCDDGSGFWPAYSAAEALAGKGWLVSLATPAAALASAIPAESAGPMLERLAAQNTHFRVLTSLASFSPGVAVVKHAFSGRLESLAIDVVVTHQGFSADDALFYDLTKLGARETYMAGDCVAPRRFSHAILEARRTANLI